MQIDSPRWQSPHRCPLCQQGSSLTFSTCPACGRLVLICDEEGSVYPNPRQLGVGDDLSINSAALCPGCSTVDLQDFRDATADEIQAAGFKPGEYI